VITGQGGDPSVVLCNDEQRIFIIVNNYLNRQNIIPITIL